MAWWAWGAIFWFVFATIVALLAVGFAQVLGRSTLRAAARTALAAYAATALLFVGWIVWQEQRGATPGLERTYRLFVVNRDGSGLRRIDREQRGATFSAPSRRTSATQHVRKVSGLEGPAVPSPDGKWIAAANYDGDIELVRRDGADEHTLVHLSGGIDNPLAGDYTVNFRRLRWSADGRRLTFRAAKVPPES